jgi:ribosomal protein L35AE/L33A
MPIGPGLDEWLPYLRKIQSAGKAVYIGVAADEVERVIAELDPRHLLIQAGGCRSRDEVDELLDRAVGWTQRRLSELGQ